MNAPQCCLIGICFATACVAQSNPVTDLQRRADQAKGAECSHLSLQAARQSLEDANHLFEKADVAAAHSAIDVSVHYAERSVDCTLQAHKGEKSAEIDLRKLIRRMKDVWQTLDSEDRPKVSESLNTLEVQRDRLLRSIFGAAAEHSGEKKP